VSLSQELLVNAAAGTDWMKKVIPTLRHAAGAKKYLTIDGATGAAQADADAAASATNAGGANAGGAFAASPEAKKKKRTGASKAAASTVDYFTEWKGSMESAMLDEKTGAARRLQLLKALKGTEPTVEVLQETKIGLTVNALRKDSSEDVRTLASALLRKWKALYRAQKSNDEQKEEAGTA
jgi:hypothetical protein